MPQEQDTASAIVEFDSREDAAAALTRDQKRLNGQTVDVEMASGSTVYVTNFPPAADEAYMRDLFREVGEILTPFYRESSNDAHLLTKSLVRLEI